MLSSRGVTNRVVQWFRVGYPSGVSEHGYQPLLALLTRRLTGKEVKKVTRELVGAAKATARGKHPISRVDAEVAIAARTHDKPLEEDIERVRARLERKGWPFAE